MLQGLGARVSDLRAQVLEYREVTKLKNTYIDVLPSLVDANGRVHTEFNQTSTATGRLSSTNPNLQNIPVRSELGRRIRKAFVAPAGPVAAGRRLQSDRAALDGAPLGRRGDARGLCGRPGHPRLHGAPDLRGRRRDDRSIPISAASRKSVNFGLLYGMSEFGLAQRLEIPKAEARAMTEAYFARFPSVRAWIDGNLEEGREQRLRQTLLGRRRYMPDLRARNFALRAAAEREATNAPLQGSAADLMKLAMVKIDRGARVARSCDAMMLLQIHDELIFEIAAERAREGRASRQERDGTRDRAFRSDRSHDQSRQQLVRYCRLRSR